MPKPKSREHKHESGILYVKAASLTDLARYVYNFDFTSGSLILSKSGGVPRLVAIGERINGLTVAYYINIDAPHGFVRYSFPSLPGERESASFTESSDASEKGCISILRVDLGPFKEARSARKEDILQVRMAGPEELVHAAVRKSVRDEYFASIYAFRHRDMTILCGFDLIDELADDRKTFYYAAVKSTVAGGFARYSHERNSFDFTETVGEHSYIYIKIIGLAEPFPFFKMPE